jgi:hypothetical protein
MLGFLHTGSKSISSRPKTKVAQYSKFSKLEPLWCRVGSRPRFFNPSAPNEPVQHTEWRGLRLNRRQVARSLPTTIQTDCSHPEMKLPRERDGRASPAGQPPSSFPLRLARRRRSSLVYSGTFRISMSAMVVDSLNDIIGLFSGAGCVRHVHGGREPLRPPTRRF